MKAAWSWRTSAWALTFGLLLAALPLVLSDASLHSLTAEDGPIEYLGAASFLGAAILFLRCWRATGTRLTIGRVRLAHNPWWLLLGVAFIFATGEEISWGQRILGFGTPTVLDGNVQGEMTLHNLPAFDPTNTDSLLHMNRMFTYFWVGFGILLPIAARWTPTRRIIDRFELPIPPVLIGLQFPVFYAVSKLYPSLGIHDAASEGGLVELRETMHAVLFLAIAVAFVLHGRDPDHVASSRAQRSSHGHTRGGANVSPCLPRGGGHVRDGHWSSWRLSLANLRRFRTLRDSVGSVSVG